MVIFHKELFVSKVLSKIASNRSSNVELSLNNWKTMPLRMRWSLRQKVVRLSDTIRNLKV